MKTVRVAVHPTATVVDAWNVRRLVVHLVKVEAGAVALGRRHRGHRMCPVQVVAKLLENRHQR